MLYPFEIASEPWRRIQEGESFWDRFREFRFKRDLSISYSGGNHEQLVVRESRTYPNQAYNWVNTALASVAALLGIVALFVFIIAMADESKTLGMMAAALLGMPVALGFTIRRRNYLAFGRTIRVRAVGSDRTIVRIDLHRGIYRVVAEAAELATIRHRWGLYHRADLYHPNGKRWGYISGWLIPSSRELFTEKVIKSPIALAFLLSGVVCMIVSFVGYVSSNAPWFFDPSAPDPGFNPALTAIGLLFAGLGILGFVLFLGGVVTMFCDERLYLDASEEVHLGRFERDVILATRERPGSTHWKFCVNRESQGGIDPRIVLALAMILMDKGVPKGDEVA